MKTLIISDVHLNHVFDEKKYLYLENLISSVDQVILNGDFWDAYRTTFDAFISSSWKGLFPQLLKKNTIYLYGNHDRKTFSDERVSLFSIEQKDSHRITGNNKEIYHIEHGHLLQKSIDITFPLSRKTLFYINNCMQRIEYILTILGSPHNILLKKENAKIKKKLQNKNFPYWYICGHTHFAELDEENKFANSGYIQHRKSSFLLIDQSGITLKTERY
jgi:predicted phosphodiesterase